MNANQLTDLTLDEMLLDTGDYDMDLDTRVDNDELIDMLLPDDLIL